MKPKTLFTLILVGLFVLTSVGSLTGDVNAQDNTQVLLDVREIVTAAQPPRNVVTVPTPISPAGTILDRTPTYKWTRVAYATKYQYRLYKGTSTTPLWTKEILSSTCGISLFNCTQTPTTALTLASYKWQVRALTGRVWLTWSSLKSFTVAAIGFNSQFNGDKTGWIAKRGTWLVNSSALYSTGVGGWNTIYYSPATFSNFDFSARVKRTGGTYYSQDPSSCICVRTGTSLNSGSYYSWYPGYCFGYSNFGDYRIYRANPDGTSTTIQNWTYSSYIIKNGWNTLRVIANGAGFWFYINGAPVKSFTDSMRSTGYVGFTFYKYPAGTSTMFEVDWAKLTKYSGSYVIEDEVGAEQQALNEAAISSGKPGSSEFDQK